MANLALSILFSSLIFIVFKLFGRYNIRTFPAIVVNYFTACTVGMLLSKSPPPLKELALRPWFWATIYLGFLFVVVFNLMAASSQKNGVSATAVATKMSLIIPVIAGVSLYGEHLSLYNIIGIGLALAAVYYASTTQNGEIFRQSDLKLPFLVFLGSGIIDASIKFLETSFMQEEEFPYFSATVFASAALAGIIFVSISKKYSFSEFTLRNIIGGVALGVPNYFSIHYILKALQVEHIGSASVFTVNNVAIVMLTTLLGILLFKEKLGSKNWIGIGLAICSIILVALF